MLPLVWDRCAHGQAPAAVLKAISEASPLPVLSSAGFLQTVGQKQSAVRAGQGLSG